MTPPGVFFEIPLFFLDSQAVVRAKRSSRLAATADLHERGEPIGICFNELIEDGAGFRRRIQPVTLRMQGK